MTFSISQSEAERMALQLNTFTEGERTTLVGIPRGGLAVAYLMKAQRLPNRTIEIRSLDDWNSTAQLTDFGRGSVYLVDDITVTGETLKRSSEGISFNGYLTMYLKRGSERGLPANLYHASSVPRDEWVTFPWETREREGKPEDAVRRLIEYLGDDPLREGLLETPRRVLSFYAELREAGKSFEATVFESQVEDLTVVRGVPFASLCEHHMLPYAGTMDVGYIPHGKVLGLSKIPRAITMLASGLTIQEGLTAQVNDLIQKIAGVESVGVVSRAVHTCVTMRGPRAPGTEMISSAMQGRFRSDYDLRSEFLSIIGG